MSSDALTLSRFAETDLPDEAATTDLARRISGHVGAGDVLLLSGELGTGKTAFARALIQSLQAQHGRPEDVPSPTYTLVQGYAAGGLEILHADLYRLSGADEVDELGLLDTEALLLVEWPERAGGIWPGAAWLSFFHQGEGRRLVLAGTEASDLAARLAPMIAAP